MKLLVFLLCLTFSANLLAKESAFGGPGITPSWSSAKKTTVGTSYSKNQKNTDSLVWFSAAEGILTETYYPTIDKPQIKDAQFLFTDGKSFFVDEKKSMTHEIVHDSPELVELLNTDKENRFSIRHKIFPSHDKSVLIDIVTVKFNVPGLKVYQLVNSALEGNGHHDNAKVDNNGFVFYENDRKVFIRSTSGYLKKSVGFVGASDGYQDLVKDYKLDWSFSEALDGNVASIGQLNIPSTTGEHSFSIIYSFDKDAKIRNTKMELAKYQRGWKNYFNKIKPPRTLLTKSKKAKQLYYRSLYVMRALEDKLNPGAMIASLSHPWGEEYKYGENENAGGYHLIWPRDLFHVSIAMLYAGDKRAALRSLRYLKRIQYKKGYWYYGERVISKKGAWPQNVWTTGEEYWSGLQLDQVGYPVQLFFHVYEMSSSKERKLLKEEFSGMLSLGLEFIKTYGPWSGQERWEENFGISPSTFSAATKALILGDKLFPGKDYKKTAMGWLNKPGDNIHTWTFTKNGIYGDGEYYLRVSGCDSYIGEWNPNRNTGCTIANSGQQVNQQRILDQGFLKLSLFGLVDPSDRRIKKSLDVVNKNIRVETPRGAGWYRYSYDAYGEEKRGRLWPLLSSEHGRYYVELQRKTGENVQGKINEIFESYLGFSNDGLMLPEQVFEASGEGTGAATPLAWSHAEYVKLLWSMDRKGNVTNLLK